MHVTANTTRCTLTPAERRIIDGWMPGYRPVRHTRRVLWYALAGGFLIGLGVGLLVGVWARIPRNPD